MPKRKGVSLKNYNQKQIDAFMEALTCQTGIAGGSVDNWYAAFNWLDRAIDDRKRTAYVVEVKRMRHIDESIEREVERKMERLPLRKGMSARAVLVYDGELDPVVEGNGFFDAIIPIRSLLGLRG